MFITAYRQKLAAKKLASRRTLLEQIHFDRANRMSFKQIAEKHNMHESTVRGYLITELENS